MKLKITFLIIVAIIFSSVGCRTDDPGSCPAYLCGYWISATKPAIKLKLDDSGKGRWGEIEGLAPGHPVKWIFRGHVLEVTHLGEEGEECEVERATISADRMTITFETNDTRYTTFNKLR